MQFLCFVPWSAVAGFLGVWLALRFVLVNGTLLAGNSRGRVRGLFALLGLVLRVVGEGGTAHSFLPRVRGRDAGQINPEPSLDCVQGDFWGEGVNETHRTGSTSRNNYPIWTEHL